ncbi:predicted protein [Naegleria gruberi]|uniref:Predicted protein n=1 Tax=Naegleria gruberi TaxID=5762 RepID=D2VWE2_NAEGR|nr:uncharacterized protein NAEGRDRAFT_73350 [Naegleria gruberi]EFC38821.1 predicted protein [Naegleria gruberi]|eukprot:XP_002671565.1 predicted protein [Naegleria gruberi strain NEG-M]
MQDSFASFKHQSGQNMMNSSTMDSQSIVGQSTQFSFELESGTDQQPDLISSFNEKITGHLTDLQSNSSYNGWKSMILYGAINLYYWYLLIVLPLVPTFSQEILNPNTTTSPFGYYGSWIFRGMAFPLTLGLDLLPYDGFVGVGIVVLLVTFFLTCLHLQNLTPKRNAKLQEILSKILGIATHTFLFIGPAMMYALTNFTDCRSTTEDGVLSFMLSRDSSAECVAGTNIIFMVLACIALIFLEMVMFFSGFVYPIFSSTGTIAFLPQDNTPVALVFASVGLRIMTSFSIPSNYLYGRAVCHIVIGIIPLIVMFYQVPFVRMIENAIYTGILGASIGSAVGVLVSTFVSSGTDIGMSLGMLGMTVGCSLLFGLLCSLIMFFYLVVTVKRVRNFLKSIDEDIQIITPLIENTLGLRNMEIFFRLSLRKRFSPDFNEDDENLEDFPRCLIYAKREAMNKSFINTGMLFLCATAISKVRDIQSLSLTLFKKALKSSKNPFTNYLITTHMKIIELGVTDAISLKSSLSVLEKKRVELKAIHKMFFKEFTNEIPNKDKIENFVTMANDIVQYCDQTFSVLLSRGRDKTILRYYANYIETVKMDKDAASALIDEANLLEEEDVRGVIRKGRHKTNRVLPTDKKMTFIEEMSQTGEEDFLGLDTRQATEKKQAIYRNALAVPYKSNWRYLMLVILSVLAVGTLSATLGLGLFNSIRATETNLVIQSCLPMLVPEGLLRYVRMRQIMLELFTNQRISLPAVGSVNRANVDNYLSYFENKIATKRDNLLSLAENSRSHRFTDSMYKDYTQRKEVYIPVPSKNGSLTYLENYMKNVSMSEITLEFAKHANYFSEFSVEAFNTTSSSFTFMFVFFNRVQAAQGFRSFCQSFQQSETTYIDENDKALWTYILVSGSISCIYILLYSIISRLEMERLSRIIKLYKKIPKDTIGVIYHNLDKTCPDHNSKSGRTFLSKPKNLAIMLPVVLLILYSATAALIYFESSMNIANSKDAITSVDNLAVLTRFTVKLSTKLGEMFAFFSVPHGRPVNAAVTFDQVELYRNEVRDFATIVQDSYDSFIETYTRGSSGGVVGKYPAIDELVGGPANCTGDRNCSLQAMLSSYVSQVTTMAEEYFNPLFSAQVEPTFYKYLSLYNMNEEIYDRVMKILDLLEKHTSESSKVISIVTFAVFFLFLFLVSFLLYRSAQVYDDEITTIRSLLSYLPLDYLESNEQIKNFIFFNGFKSEKVAKKEEDENSMNNLLDSMVDGAFLSNERGEVVLFNKAAQKKQKALLAEEKKNSEALLRNILPEAVASKLKSGDTFIAERFTDVTCFFSDMVGFTSLSSNMNPSDLVLMLNEIVNGFDDLTDKYTLEKIKTIGDAYFCVGGLHNNSQSDHPERVLRFSIDCLDVIKIHNENHPDSRINIRLGINTGSVVAGVIGKKKFAYDLWGDTINMASRMESTSLAGRIHISRSTYERVHDLGLEFEERQVEVKGKGLCQTYLLLAKYHADPLAESFVNHHLMDAVEPMDDDNVNQDHD